MAIKDILKGKLGSENGRETRRFDEIVNESASSILKELGGYGINESKIMVDNLVLFTNCSGGTGASTIASNVAHVLANNNGMNVLVLDLNIVCPIQHIYFDKSESTSKKNDLVDFLTGQCAIGEATITKDNISIMYAIDRSVADEINCEDNMAIENLKLLLSKSRDLYDIVIIDCPMKISNAICNIAMYMADKIYTVWDEGISSVLNTDRVMRQLGFTGIDSFAKMFVIMNKKTSVKYSKFPFEKLRLPLIETLPFSTDVICSSLDASIYCASGKARNKNGGEFERGIMSLARKIVLIGGKTELKDIDNSGYKIEREESKEQTASQIAETAETKEEEHVETEEKQQYDIDI